MSFSYDPPTSANVIVTPMIDLAWARIKPCHHPRGQFVVVTGRAGAGKTTALSYIGEQVTVDCDAGVPHAFRSAYFVSTDLRNTHPRTLERLIHINILSLGLGISVANDMRQLRTEELRKILLLALRQRGIEMLIIDEAGGIPAEGLSILANLLNHAAAKPSWRLTIVLVGMDELPVTVGMLPQVERRVADTIWFEPYGAEDAVEVLGKVHPFFATLDLRSESGQEVMEFLLSPEVSDGGQLGRMIQLVEHVASHCRDQRRTFSLHELRTVHLLEALDRERSVAEAERGYRGPPRDSSVTKPASARGRKVANASRRGAGFGGRRGR